MQSWTPTLRPDGAARYIQLADAIAEGVANGTLSLGDRLPPQRRLADRLGIDFTTVSRGYAEARRRGLINSHVGRGTFVARAPAEAERPELRRQSDADLTMNLPPEPQDADLLERMQEGLQTVSANLIDLLRYQSATGGQVDKDAASTWLSLRGLVPSLDRIAVTPGAHPTMLAILMSIARPGDTVLCEDVTYPGLRSIAGRLGLRLVGLPGDAEGIDTDALDAAIRQHAPKALYLNPTLQNPTTRTISLARRERIAEVITSCKLPLIEDDAYGFIPPNPPAPLASFAPDLVWHIGGLAKCIGAGLRLAYTVAPNSHASRELAHNLKLISVMPSPLMMALATRVDHRRHRRPDTTFHPGRNRGPSGHRGAGSFSLELRVPSTRVQYLATLAHGPRSRRGDRTHGRDRPWNNAVGCFYSVRRAVREPSRVPWRPNITQRVERHFGPPCIYNVQPVLIYGRLPRHSGPYTQSHRSHTCVSRFAQNAHVRRMS